MSRWYEIENADQIASPTILVYPDRIDKNLVHMIDLVGGVAKLRPHVKTHKMPRVVQMMLAAGITKFKTSTIAETEMTAAAGGKDVLLAYQPVGPNVARLAELVKRFPDTTFSALVDDQATLDRINEVMGQSGVQLNLLVDLNVGMNRTGIQSQYGGMELCLNIEKAEHVTFGGLHAYDGHLHSMDAAKLAQEAEVAFEPVWMLKHELEKQGLNIDRLVVSGTPTSGLMSRYPDVEVGAGTMVLWDAGQCAHSPGLDFINAAVVMTRVISRPGEELLCLDLGYKAIASEFAPPRVKLLGIDDAVEVSHSEEHLVIQTKAAAQYPVGTVIYGLPFHVCPTVALHQEVWAVRGGVAQEAWEVVARNRRITI